jgi:hypothetical protein
MAEVNVFADDRRTEYIIHVHDKNNNTPSPDLGAIKIND